MSCECHIFLQQSFEVEETPSTLIGEKNIICNRYRNILPCKSYIGIIECILRASTIFYCLHMYSVSLCTLFAPVHRLSLYTGGPCTQVVPVHRRSL